MVQSCSALNCTVRRKKGLQVKFHTFPKDPHLRKLWIVATRRQNFEPSSTAVICQNHFQEDDYMVNVHGNTVLKKGVVPTVFDFNTHLIKEEKPDISLIRVTATKDCTSEDETKDFLNACVSAEITSEITNNSQHNQQCTELQVPQPEEDDKHSLHKFLQLDTSLSSNCTTTIENPEKRKGGRLEPFYIGDFKEHDLECPRKRDRFFTVYQETIKKYQKKQRLLRDQVKRKNTKIANLKALVNTLKEKYRSSSEASFLLKVIDAHL